MSKPVVLAYWNTRCLAEPIRLMLSYLGIKFEDKRYPVGDAPDYDKSEWKKDKFSMGFDFPNLPYLIDGDVKISESWAILKYLARESTRGLYPTEKKEIINSEMLEGFLEDVRWQFINICYYSTDKTISGNLEKFKEKLALTLSLVETFIGNNPWLIGKNLTYVDFVLCETLDQIDLFNKDYPCYNIDDYQKIKSYMARFMALDNIASYRSSDRFVARPVQSKYTYWSGKAK